jgi:predicted nucleic acid-binding protein
LPFLLFLKVSDVRVHKHARRRRAPAQARATSPTAVAEARDLTLVTRNAGDFSQFGQPIVNP